MDTILPCPFCGESPEIENCEDGSIWASCSDSSMKCPAYGNGAELAAWNRRRPRPSAPVQPVAMEGAVNLVCNRLNEHSRELGGAGMIAEAQDYAHAADLVRRYFGDLK